MSETKRTILNKVRRETPRVLASIVDAEVHPSTIEHPGADAPLKRKVMHATHAALIKTGKLAQKHLELKTPNWPFKADNINVLGYGAEKVAYRLSDRGKDTVVSVYHLPSISKSPHEVIEEKRKTYEIYKKYFGELVLPTSFVILDNPWGDGGKPASVQPYVEDIEKFADFSNQEIIERAKHDEKFEDNLHKLTEGYNMMIEEGYCPDFASSNLVMSGSNIVIFDTGFVYPAEKRASLGEGRVNYSKLENLSNNL